MSAHGCVFVLLMRYLKRPISRMEISLLDTGMQLMVQLRSVRRSSCLASSPLCDSLWPSSDAVLPTTGSLPSARPTVFPRYRYISWVSCFTLRYWDNVRTFYAPAYAPSLDFISILVPVQHFLLTTLWRLPIGSVVVVDSRLHWFGITFFFFFFVFWGKCLWTHGLISRDCLQTIFLRHVLEHSQSTNSLPASLSTSRRKADDANSYVELGTKAPAVWSVMFKFYWFLLLV